MLNLLRADFYKLKRSKSFFISLGILVLIVAYILIDFKSSAHLKEQLSPSTWHWIYMFFAEKSFLPYFIPLLQAIFITMLISGEYSSGTIKDPVSLGFSRGKIYLSKLVTVSVGTLLLMLAAVLTIGVLSPLVFGFYGSFSMVDLMELVRMLLIQGLLYTAYGSLLLMIAFLIKNTGGTMAFSILFSAIYGSLGSFFGEGVLGRMLLMSHFTLNAVPQPQGSDMGIALSVALGYLILFSGIGGFMFKKQDIK